MDKVIYKVNMNLGYLSSEENYATEYPIIKDKKDRYIIIDMQEYNEECDYLNNNLYMNQKAENVNKEDFYIEIYKEFDEDELSLNVPLYPRFSIDNISITVYSLNKEEAFKIAKKYINDEIESTIKTLEGYKNTVSKIELK